MADDMDIPFCVEKMAHSFPALYSPVVSLLTIGRQGTASELTASQAAGFSEGVSRVNRSGAHRLALELQAAKKSVSYYEALAMAVNSGQEGERANYVIVDRNASISEIKVRVCRDRKNLKVYYRQNSFIYPFAFSCRSGSLTACLESREL